MRTIIKQIMILGLGAVAATQVACGSKKTAYQSNFQPASDSVVMARADSIARAEGRGDTSSKTVAVVTHSPDDAFVIDVAKRYTQEMEIIRMGAENEGDRKINVLAKKMLNEHAKTFRPLDGYIGRKGLTLSTDTMIDISYANAYDNHQWDSAWVSLIETHHNNMIAMMETAKTKVTDPELQTMISNTLPVLHNHLAMVEAIKPHVK